MMQVSFENDARRSRTKFSGRWERVCIVYLDGNEFRLGLADTARCAQSADAALATVKNLAERAKIGDAGEVAGAAIQLRAHCQHLTGWKERQPRY